MAAERNRLGVVVVVVGVLSTSVGAALPRVCVYARAIDCFAGLLPEPEARAAVRADAFPGGHQPGRPDSQQHQAPQLGEVKAKVVGQDGMRCGASVCREAPTVFLEGRKAKTNK